MKNASLFFGGSLLLLGCLGFMNTNEPDQTQRIITVTGSADVEVPPDEVELVIQISEYSHEKKASIEHIQSELYEKLEGAGIAKANIGLKDVGNQYYWRYYWDWYYWNNPSTRPFITKQISVKLENVSQADKVVAALKMRGITNVYLGKSSNKQISEYRKQVKLEAVKAAKEKAQYMLDALGERLGGVVSIKEIDGDSATASRRHLGYYGYPWYGYGYYGGTNGINSNSLTSNSSMNAGNMGIAGTNGAAAEENGLKKIKLRYEVEAVFQITSKR